jgi:hypothetical protein
MKTNLWKSIYTNKVFETSIDWMPHYGGWELVGTLERNSKEKNKNNKLKDFEYWIQQPYNYLYNREDIINVLNIVKDDFEYVCNLYDDLENIYKEVDIITYKEKQPILFNLNNELNFAFDAITEVETYTKSSYYFNENLNYINQLLDCVITKTRSVYNTIKAGV